jgi:hypothetical protein
MTQRDSLVRLSTGSWWGSGPRFPTRSRIELRAVSRCPTRINVLALRGGGGRRAGCVCVGSPPHPPGQAHYRPIFMAAITRQSSAGGLCSPASEWVGCSRLRCYRSHLMGLNQRKGLWSTRPLDQVCWRRRNLPSRKSHKCPVFRSRRPTIQLRRAWRNPRQRGVRLFRTIRPSTARPVTATRQGNRTSARFSVTHAMARIHGRTMALTAVATAVGLSTRLHRTSSTSEKVRLYREALGQQWGRPKPRRKWGVFFCRIAVPT